MTDIPKSRLLQAAAICAAKPADCHALAFVQLERRRNRLTITASEGHVLFHAKVKDPGPDKLWYTSVTHALQGRALPVRKVTSYPNMRSFIRDMKANYRATPEAPRVAVQAAFLHRAARIAGMLNPGKDCVPVVVEKRSELDPLRFTFAEDVWLIAMPIRA